VSESFIKSPQETFSRKHVLKELSSKEALCPSERKQCVLKGESKKAVSLRKKALSLPTLRYNFVAALHRAPKTA
jgi:hypothetical protein